MRLVVQRVSSASVQVGGEVRSDIEMGLVVLIGVGIQDSTKAARRLAGKVARLRIFSDDAGKMNRSITDVGGQILVVSQFTLYGDVSRGNRPSFVESAEPETAKRLIADFVAELKSNGLVVKEGEFGAMMRVSLVNEGPVTILVEG